MQDVYAAMILHIAERLPRCTSTATPEALHQYALSLRKKINLNRSTLLKTKQAVQQGGTAYDTPAILSKLRGRQKSVRDSTRVRTQQLISAQCACMH